jgi:hypothetical protein
VHYGEDWEMWVRISSRFPVVQTPEHLANYRTHDNNITSRYFLSGQNIRDISKVVDIIQEYLPPSRRHEMRRRALRNFSQHFARSSNIVYHAYKKPGPALYLAYRALRMDINGVTLNQLLKLCVKVAIRYRWRESKLSIEMLGKRYT